MRNDDVKIPRLAGEAPPLSKGESIGEVGSMGELTIGAGRGRLLI